MVDQRTAPRVRFWADPCCPWAWTALTWLIDAAFDKGVEVELKCVSLAILDAKSGQGRDPKHRAGLAMSNVIMAARLEHGAEAAIPLFKAMGRRMHEEGFDPALEAQAVIYEALDEVGLGVDLVAMASERGTAAAVRAEHAEALSLVGAEAAGSPIIAIDDAAFFGPVLDEAPKDAAGFFDAICAVASTPGFYELKRGRSS